MINVSRSSAIFPPGKYNGDIHVIGAGATGSHLVVELITHGIEGSQIHVYDFDFVEEHNVANQVYTYKDVGKLKVNALQDIISERYEENIRTYAKRVNGEDRLTGVVFLLVDTFKARGEIFKGMNLKPDVKLVVETRLSPRIAIVRSLDPCNLSHIRHFEDSLLDDDDENVPVSACGTRQTVGSTVRILSAMAAQEFFKWANDRNVIGNYVYLTTEWDTYKEQLKD